MEPAQHIDALIRDGGLLADAAALAGPDAPVPSCPPWRVRDLLRHLGYVHRWAAAHVAERHPTMLPSPPEREILDAGPGDAELIGWFRDGHAALVATLRAADPDLACATFLPAPSPLAFWARRQAHETAIHRVDAQLAAAASSAPSPPLRELFSADFAADGVDELVTGFAPRGRRLRASPRRVLGAWATDTGDEWLVEITPDGARAARGGGAADCLLAGPAAGLYLLLWNRCAAADVAVEVTGDGEVARLWRDGLRVRWN